MTSGFTVDFKRTETSQSIIINYYEFILYKYISILLINIIEINKTKWISLNANLLCVVPTFVRRTLRVQFRSS